MALVLHYKFDETSGVTCEDSAGSNDGTFENGPGDNSQWVTGHDGNALEFDGSDDHVDCGDPMLSIFRSSFSISAWIKAHDANPPNTLNIFGVASNNAMVHIWIYYDGTVRISYLAGANSAYWTSNDLFADGAFPDFIHLCVTFADGDAIKVYIDGAQYDDNGSTVGDMSSVDMSEYASDSSYNPFVGAFSSYGGAAYPFDGVIDEFQIYDTALTDAEVLELHETGEIGGPAPVVGGAETSFALDGTALASRVVKGGYGKITRTADDFKSGKMTVKMSNTDGYFNEYFADVYKTARRTAVFSFGYEDASSLDPATRAIFTGTLQAVRYSKETCTMEFRDKVFDLSQRVVGTSSVPVTFNDVIPTDIIWTLVSCYGEMTWSDVDTPSYNQLASVFSADSITNDARFTGEKVNKAVSEILKMNSAAGWCDGDGKLYFRRFYEADSMDTVINITKANKFEIDVETQRLINNSIIHFGYAVESNYFTGRVAIQDTPSVNSFGIHENVIENDQVWFTTSVDAMNRAQREVSLYAQPPKRFTVGTGIFGLHRTMAETVRLVNSFFDVTSESAHRIMEQSIDINNGKIEFKVTTAGIHTGFYLDISSLDGDDRLL